MRTRQVIKRRKQRPLLWMPCLAILIVAAIGYWPKSEQISAVPTTAVRQVNVPYQQGASQPYPTQSAVFWFGQVINTSNYADVHTIYNENNLS